MNLLDKNKKIKAAVFIIKNKNILLQPQNQIVW